MRKEKGEREGERARERKEGKKEIENSPVGQLHSYK